MDEGNHPGRFEAVLGAAFCSVAAVRLPGMLTGHECPESWQWLAAALGAIAMTAHMAWRINHPRHVKKAG